MGLLLAANMETIALLGAAWWLAGYLNENYPRDFDWLIVTALIACVVVAHSWFVILRTILRMDRKGEEL